ncbi:MAG: REP-associated tyrosine transposase [Stenotrophomonas rhizophila]|uniref:REP-associated tyrosine transposase n=1 Tax=Stenotrophomonas rhizophila TaxID=216778 RepID=UPI003D0F5B61
MSSPRLLIGRRSVRGAYYMLTSTVADRRKLFVDAARVECVVEALRCSDREARSRTLAWVVMPDHVHWLMQLRDGNISRCMQAFKSRASRAFNLHTGAQGSVWQRGFYDHCVRSDESLERQARYLIENPVRAGLAGSVGEYPYLWSRWPMTPETSPAEDSQPR